jgi:hypothetical protein
MDYRMSNRQAAALDRYLTTPPEHYDDDCTGEEDCDCYTCEGMRKLEYEEAQADAAYEERVLREMEERDSYERMIRMHGGCPGGKCNY